MRIPCVRSAIIAVVAVVAILTYRWTMQLRKGCLYTLSSGTPLTGKTILITGANSGIGLEAAKQLATLGANIIMACRNMDKCHWAAQQVCHHVVNNNVTCSEYKLQHSQSNVKKYIRVTTEHLDLASLANVHDCAARIKSTYPQLNYLINNAGVMLENLQWTMDGYEMHFGVNHLGHFLLTRLLLPHMRKSGEQVRVVMISSNLHSLVDEFDLNDPGLTRGYHYLKSYGYSKLANILHARELARRENQERNTKDGARPPVIAVSLHPGMVVTEIGKNINSTIYGLLKLIGPYFIMKTTEESVQTILHSILDSSVEQHNGDYYQDCAPITPSTVAQNNETAKHLWTLSEELISRYLI